MNWPTVVKKAGTGYSLMPLLLFEQIERVDLDRLVGVGRLVRRRRLLASEQVADSFKDIAGFIAHVDTELFGDTDAALQQQAAEREFIQMGLGIAQPSLDGDKIGQPHVGCVRRRARRHQP